MKKKNINCDLYTIYKKKTRQTTKPWSSKLSN